MSTLKDLKVFDLRLQLRYREASEVGFKPQLKERLRNLVIQEGNDPNTFVFGTPIGPRIPHVIPPEIQPEIPRAVPQEETMFMRTNTREEAANSLRISELETKVDLLTTGQQDMNEKLAQLLHILTGDTHNSSELATQTRPNMPPNRVSPAPHDETVESQEATGSQVRQTGQRPTGMVGIKPASHHQVIDHP